VKRQLKLKYGAEFVERAERNADNAVNERVVHKLSIRVRRRPAGWFWVTWSRAYVLHNQTADPPAVFFSMSSHLAPRWCWSTCRRLPRSTSSSGCPPSASGPKQTRFGLRVGYPPPSHPHTPKKCHLDSHTELVSRLTCVWPPALPLSACPYGLLGAHGPSHTVRPPLWHRGRCAFESTARSSLVRSLKLTAEACPLPAGPAHPIGWSPW
jgi:hypothetical protein